MRGGSGASGDGALPEIGRMIDVEECENDKSW